MKCPNCGYQTEPEVEMEVNITVTLKNTIVSIGIATCLALLFAAATQWSLAWSTVGAVFVLTSVAAFLLIARLTPSRGSRRDNNSSY